MDIENYQLKRAQVEKYNGRFAVVFSPEVHPEVGALIRVNGTPGMVTDIVGGNRFRADFLGAEMTVAECDVTLSDGEPTIDADLERASNATWVVDGIPWKRAPTSSTVERSVIEVWEPLNHCAPLITGAIHLAFAPAPMTPNFFQPDRTFGNRAHADFVNDAACGLDVFARLIKPNERVVIHLEESDLNSIPNFVQSVSSDATIVICVSLTLGLHHIIETMRVADVGTTWLVEQNGTVEVLRSSSKFESARASEIRTRRQQSIDTELFANLVGDEYESEVAEDPVLFDAMELT